MTSIAWLHDGNQVYDLSRLKHSDLWCNIYWGANSLANIKSLFGTNTCANSGTNISPHTLANSKSLFGTNC